ncbi:MAG: hypothetical protein NT154_47105 [Verrucomicrobia bacterium]|nr:hypothetical protein [Verrucomicrobiota bacterium]
MNQHPKITLHSGEFLALVKEGRWEYADRTSFGFRFTPVLSSCPLASSGMTPAAETKRMPKPRGAS